jgi:biotin carboxyl carrier protein
MSKLYKVKVNDAFEFDIDSEEIQQLDAIKTSDNSYHILKDHKTFHAELSDSQFNQKKYTVKINANFYTVDINNDLDELIKAMGFEVGASKMVNDIKAPMPGLILDIIVKMGQEVKENDSLLILEAMKMENVLTSPRDGIIKSISVKKGDAVEKNQLLVEFE